MRVGPLISAVAAVFITAGAFAAGSPEDFDLSAEVAGAGLAPSGGTHRITVTGRGTGSEDVCDTGSWGPFHGYSCNASGAQDDAREEAETEAREDARDKCRARRGSVEREYDPVTTCAGSFDGRRIECRSSIRVRCEVPDNANSVSTGSRPRFISEAWGEPAVVEGLPAAGAPTAQD